MPAEIGEPLSERELEIVTLVAEGLTNREIAERLYISPNTIKVHLRNIFTKTDVNSRTELTMMAVQENWISVMDTEDAEDILPEAKPQAIPVRVEAWPWQRWLSAGLALLICAVVVFLPKRSDLPADQGPGNVFGASNTVYGALPTETTGKWQELSPLDSRRAGVATAFIHQQLFVFGGMSADGALAQVDRYDITTEQWHPGAAMPSARANIQAVGIGETVYVPGGCTSDWHPVDTLLSFDVQTEDWHTLNPIPQSLCAYALTVLDESIYLFGGWDGAEYGTASYSYDSTSDTWSSIRSPNVPRGFGSAAVLDGKIYYVGGYDGQREYNTCEVYDPAVDIWEACAPLLQPRGGLGLATVGAKLYAVGGGWDTNLGFSERYSPLKDAWGIMETPLVGEWRNIGLAGSDTALYVVGGWDGSDFLNRSYRLEILPWRVFIPGAVREP